MFMHDAMMLVEL